MGRRGTEISGKDWDLTQRDESIPPAPHLFGDMINKALPNDATPEGHEVRIKLLQSARTEATIAAYERAFKDSSNRNELVTPHDLDIGDWVLVRHETPNKFEPKWFGPYQIMEKMLLGTYRLQDPNGTELAALIHGNRLIKAAISTAEKLRDLWASPAVKDKRILLKINLKRKQEQQIFDEIIVEPPVKKSRW